MLYTCLAAILMMTNIEFDQDEYSDGVKVSNDTRLWLHSGNLCYTLVIYVII